MSRWEDICKRCGLCCFEKSVDANNCFVLTRTPCRHLNIISRECRVYHKRLDVGEGCVKLTPELVAKADWLPEDCAYRTIRTRDAVRGTRKTLKHDLYHRDTESTGSRIFK